MKTQRHKRFRVPGSDFVSQRDARLRRQRQRRAERDAARSAGPVDISGVTITICEPAVARGAYDAARNLQAAARLKAKAKRR